MKQTLLIKKIVLALAVSSCVTIGQVSAAEDNLFQLDQLTVTADRITQTVATTPNNVTVITAAQLEEKGARTLADALFGISGVNILNYGGTSQKAKVSILGSDVVVVMVDGKRMNLPQGIAMNGAGVDINTILLSANIERIEIVRTGGSVLYGADAVGGVINIITKKGLHSTPATASIASGNNGTSFYSFTTGGQEKTIHWHISGVQDSTDGQRSNSSYKGKAFSLRLDQSLNTTENLTMVYDYYGKHNGMPGSLTSPRPIDYGNILRHNWSAEYTKEHCAGKRVFRYYNNDQIYSGNVWGNSFHHNNIVRAFEYQDNAKLNTTNLLTWGGEWRKDQVISSDLGNRTGINKAFFLQDQYTVNSSTKLTLGLRRDDNSIWGACWLPKAAFIYQANANTSYFANWGKVFSAPNFESLYWPFDGMGIGNANLRPEQGWTAEIGMKTKLSHSSEATVSLFKRHIADRIKWNFDGVTYSPQNISRYTANGVNADLTIKLSPVTVVNAGYTYLDSRDQNNTSTGEPLNTFNIGLTIHQDKLSQRISCVFEDRSGTTSRNRVDSHFIVNANTTYDLNKTSSLFLTINNLFNKKYQTIKNYPADKRTVLFGIKYTL